MLRELQTGVSRCVTVTLVDGHLLARSAFHHSMNYRSVVAFGRARKIDQQAHKLRALRLISEHLLAGRWNDLRYPSGQELKSTAVLDSWVEEASRTSSTGPPLDDEDDYSLPVRAGILPLRLETKAPIPDCRLTTGTEMPQYPSRWRHR